MALTKLTQNLIDGTLVTSVNSLTGAVTLETGTDWVNTIQTSNFTAVAGKGYFVNTTSGEITVTLPAGTAGDSIRFTNMSSLNASGVYSASSYSWTINPNGSEKIMRSSTLVLDESTASFELFYSDAANGWIVNGIS